jgi:dUTP pyrophosphatase
MHIPFKWLGSRSRVPQRQTSGSSGFDLHAVEGTTLGPAGKLGDVQMVGTGLAVSIHPGYEGQVRCRSGLALEGIALANGVGTIDSDYRGEIKVILRNLGHNSFTILPGTRVAQLVICPVVPAELVEVDDLDETDRGAGGLGSTGVE